MSDLLIGCHVSNSGDEMLFGSVKEALNYNANCFMVYLGPPQSTKRKDVSLLEADKMKKTLVQNNISLDNVIIHAPYIMNLAQSNDEKRDFAVDFLSDEMKKMATIGFKYIVVHPGAHMQIGVDRGLELISDSIKRVLQNTAFDNTYIAIETMAGKGSECCKTFEEIRKLLELLDFDKRIVVCLDTCHIFDSGYDIINEYEKVISDFDRLIGLDRLKVIHLNDSKNVCGSHKDRHENIGFGNIGFDALMKFVSDDRFKNIPKILETPFVKGENNDFPPYKHEIMMIKNKKFNINLINNIMNDK